MGTQRAPVSLPCVAALIVVLGLAATTLYIYFVILHGPIHDVAAATAAHDAPAGFLPAQPTEMGDRPDCW